MSRQEHDQQQVVGFIRRPQGKSAEDVRTALLSVPSQRRESLVEQRNHALDILVGRGVIDRSLHERATGTELGGLAYLDGVST